MRKILAIIAGKATRILLRILGRNASSFPGTVALKLCPNLLSKMTLPKLTVAVTGSNGKTSTTELINHTAQLTGKRIISNSYGSNQIEGVTAMMLQHCTIGGFVKADIAVIESDERFCQYTFSHFTPDYILINNLFRDQLTRNGHSEFVRKETAKGLPQGSTLIINADEPVSASLAQGRDKVIRYGVSPSAFCESADTYHAYHDGAYCPVCYSKMQYDGVVNYHLGNFHCDSCGFKRGDCTHEVSGRDGDLLIIDGKYSLKPQMMNTMFAYNIVAAFTVAVEVFGLSPEATVESLDGYLLQNGRIRTFDIDGHEGIFLLSKHENSMGYNGGLNAVAEDSSDEKTLLIIVDRLSRKYTANDMSWLWDIDFEKADNESIKRIIVGGGFAHDLAVRLIFAGVDENRITVEPDLDKMMDSLYHNPIGKIFVLTCFTDVDKFTGRLRREEKQ